jgi:hypothetical protein
VEAPDSLDREWSVSQEWRGSGERYGTNYVPFRTDQSRVRDWLSLRVRQRYSIVGYNGTTAKASINLQKITLSTFDNSLV